MNLIKDKWTKNDIKEFENYLESLQNKEKQEWAKNMLNTDLPVLALKTMI